MRTPIEYVEDIDGQFFVCRSKKLSRMSVEWGKFSVDMNREIKERIENDDPEKMTLKYVFIYWTTVSQLLELYYTKRGGLFGKGKIRRKSNECKELKNIILNGVGANPLGLPVESSFTDFVTRFVGR